MPYQLGEQGINICMTDYCVNLNLSINPLIESVTINDINPNNSEQWMLVNLDYINPDLKELFDSIGLTIKIAALFTLIPTYVSPIHLDGSDVDDLVKLNWSYNPNHNMVWYKIKEGASNQPMTRKSNLGNRAYVYYQREEIEEAHRAPVGFPSLIQAGIPHNVERYEGVRKCLSILLIRKVPDVNGKLIVSMNDAKTMFANYI